MASPKPDESTLFKLRAPHRQQVWRTDRLELDALNKYGTPSYMAPEQARAKGVGPAAGELHRFASGDRREAPPGFEPGMADLQSAALPLG